MRASVQEQEWRKKYQLAFASLGGKARAVKLSAERRQAIARKASRARWAKHRKTA